MGFGGFSWKRATGLSKAKAKVGRSIGIPLTRSGRQRKFGAMLGGSVLGALPTGRSAGSGRRTVPTSAADDFDLDERIPYGIYQERHWLGCLAIVLLVVLTIALFPIGAALGGAIELAYLYRTRKKKSAAFAKVVAKVKAFKARMDAVDVPAFGPFTRGKPESIDFAEAVMENHLRLLGALESSIPSDHEEEYGRLMASFAEVKTLKDALGEMELRAEALRTMAVGLGYPEAEYLVAGVYADNNLDVAQVRDAANAWSRALMGYNARTA